MSNVTLDASTERICQTCGYDVRGLTGNRCPECGQRFDLTPEANIPWLKRAAIGSWSAYWQTVAMVMFHPRRFSERVWNAPRVHPAAAMSFRVILIVQAIVSTMIVAAIATWGNAPARWSAQLFWLVVVEIACVVAVGIFLIVGTDLVLEDSWQRALNHYACAPLAMVPIGEFLVLITEKWQGPFDLVSTLVLSLIFGWWWIDQVLMMYVVKRSVMTSVGHALVMPLAWAFLAGVSILCGIAAASMVNLVLSH